MRNMFDLSMWCSLGKWWKIIFMNGRNKYQEHDQHKLNIKGNNDLLKHYQCFETSSCAFLFRLVNNTKQSINKKNKEIINMVQALICTFLICWFCLILDLGCLQYLFFVVKLNLFMQYSYPISNLFPWCSINVPDLDPSSNI